MTITKCFLSVRKSVRTELDRFCEKYKLPAVPRSFSLSDIQKTRDTLFEICKGINKSPLGSNKRDRLLKILSSWVDQIDGLMNELSKTSNQDDLVAYGKNVGFEVSIREPRQS
jgi:septation ring formation regulator EzrA